MSQQIFTPPMGVQWDIKKRPRYSTIKQDTTSGRGQLRIANQTYPIWEYEFSWDYLPGGEQSGILANNAYAQVLGFFMAMKGGYDTFLFSDPNDNSVTQKQFGIGDGTTTAFQLTRPIGSGVDIVQNTDASQRFPDPSYPPGPFIFKHDWQSVKNLLANSEVFDGTAPNQNWILTLSTQCSITPNAGFAPDSSNTATKFYMNVGSATECYEDQDSSIVPFNGEQYTLSVYLRADVPCSVVLRMVQTTGQNDTLQTFTLTTQWKRYTLTTTMASVGTGTLRGRFGISSGLTPCTFYVWGAQLELGATATTYQKTGPQINGVNAGPTYQYPGLRTNSLLWSQDFSNAVWSGAQYTVLGNNTIVAPDGTTTAEELQASSGATDAFINQHPPTPSSFSSKFMTFSVWLKVPSGTQNLNIYIGYNIGGGAMFPTLTTCALTTRWKRFTVGFGLPAGLTDVWCQIGAGASWTNLQKIHVWGAQFENWGFNNPGTWAWAGLGAGIDGGSGYIPTTSAIANATDYTIGSTGIVTFGTAPVANTILQWTGNYYYRLRFAEDIAEFNEFMFQFWELKSLKMESIIL